MQFSRRNLLKSFISLSFIGFITSVTEIALIKTTHQQVKLINGRTEGLELC